MNPRKYEDFEGGEDVENQRPQVFENLRTSVTSASSIGAAVGALRYELPN